MKTKKVHIKTTKGTRRVKKLMKSSYSLFLKDDEKAKRTKKRAEKAGQGWRQMTLEEFFAIVYASGYQLQIKPHTWK